MRQNNRYPNKKNNVNKKSVNGLFSVLFSVLCSVLCSLLVAWTCFGATPLGASGTAPPAPKQINTAKLDRFIENARKEWKVPGVAVALVKDGKIILAKGYGVREHGKNETVNEKTLFAIASNTKAFTAATLALLKEDGRIKWDDRVREYLPYFRLYDPYVTEAMTLRDLLCHRSGLGTFSGDLLWYESSHTPEEVVKRARYLKPTFGFRAGYGYSNIMYITAGEVIGAVTGKKWDQVVKERIFRPLGMTDSHMGIADLEKYDNVATPHYVYLDGRVTTVPYSTSENLAAGGAINSSAIEMAQWVNMLLNNGMTGKAGKKRILSEQAIRDMWTPHVMLPVSAAREKIFPSTHFRGYGLGWFLNDYRGYKVVSHGGALDGMISTVALVPELKLGLVVLTNSINSLSSAVMYRVIDSYTGAESRDWNTFYLERYRKGAQEIETWSGIEPRDDGKGWKINPDDYTGTYGGPMYGDARVTKKDGNNNENDNENQSENQAKGKLVLDFLPSPLFISDLTPLHYDVFLLKLRNPLSFVPHGTGTVEFLRDKAGKVVEMKVDIPNRDFFFTELEFKRKD